MTLIAKPQIWKGGSENTYDESMTHTAHEGGYSELKQVAKRDREENLGHGTNEVE